MPTALRTHPPSPPGHNWLPALPLQPHMLLGGLVLCKDDKTKCSMVDVPNLLVPSHSRADNGHQRQLQAGDHRRPGSAQLGSSFSARFSLHPPLKMLSIRI